MYHHGYLQVSFIPHGLSTEIVKKHFEAIFLLGVLMLPELKIKLLQVTDDLITA